jgi:hypothetical protein
MPAAQAMHSLAPKCEGGVLVSKAPTSFTDDVGAYIIELSNAE